MPKHVGMGQECKAPAAILVGPLFQTLLVALGMLVPPGLILQGEWEHVLLWYPIARTILKGKWIVSPSRGWKKQLT